MAETIESFVAKLQDEGVKAGKEAAEKIRADAQAEAERIQSEARQKADSIVEDAQSKAEANLQRGRTELELAARDALLQMREALSRALESLLTGAAKEKLSDTDFLGDVLKDLISQYAHSDLSGTGRIEVNVSAEMKDKLASWAAENLGRDAFGSGEITVDLKGELAESGFEYTTAGGTVEVTLDSVVAVLKGLVGPKLMEVVDRAAAGADEGAAKKD